MRLVLAIVLGVSACAAHESEIVDPTEQAAGERAVAGVAENAKLGAVIITAQGPVYVDKLSEWPVQVVGKNVQASGEIVVETGAGSRTVQGIVGEYQVLLNPVWRVAP